MTSSTVGPRRSSKALSKAKLAPRKGHGQCLMVVWWSADSLIQYKFLNPSETIVPEKYAQQIDENYRKLQCLQLALINREGPVFQQVAQPVLQKLNLLGYEVLPHPPYSPDLLPMNHLFSHLFAGKTLLQPAGGRKCFPRVDQILRHGLLHYRNKQSYFSLTKMIVMMPYFD